MFVPVPPQSNQPAPEPPDDPNEPNELDDEAADEDAADFAIAAMQRPPVWPAVVRWARLCRLLAFVSLVIFGFFSAQHLYHAITAEPQIMPFMPQISPATYLGYAFLYAVYAIASCISLLGFAELLQVFLSIEAASRRQREPSESDQGDDA
jgi:hypothetical protein